ncbi:MAG: O-antigen ligase family protein [Planctomycetia bacterium]|nr:MAG: O-antigen ligase family protein [Planctomycetia bacterium]
MAAAPDGHAERSACEPADATGRWTHEWTARMNDRRLSIGLTGIVLAMLSGATLLYSGVGPFGGAAAGGLGGWHPLLAAIARALTLPIATSGISDVRDVMPFVGLGCAALVVALAAPRMDRSLWDSYGAASPGLRWLITTSVLILVAGMASAWANDSMYLSRGWLLRFAAGAGWAWLLGRYLPGRALRSAVGGMLALGAVACGLALAHRADLGVRYFSWPIGTLTITAGLAAVWSAMAGGWLLARRQTASDVKPNKAEQPDPARRLIGLCVLVAGGIAAYVLQQSGRRAAMLGCLAGVALIVAFRLWIGGAVASRGRLLRRGLVMVAGAALLGSAAWYVQRERASGQRERAIPVALRFGYLRLSGELIRAQPLLGVGPDMTVVNMTNAVAPLRADMPQVYHGTIDAAVHNEWVQAAVELGVPAGVLYLALPIGSILIALRRAAITPDVLALIAGLAAIVVTEAGSITLRGPMMPPWYWTMLGLLIAVSRPRPTSDSGSAGDQPARSSSTHSPGMSATGKAIGLAIALGCAIVVHREYLGATADSVLRHTREADAEKFEVVGRLFSEKTILARFRAAEQALASAQASSPRRTGDLAYPEINAEALRRAALLWGELYEEIPGLAGVIENYARTLLLARKPTEARFVLRRAIEEKLDPYSAGVNVLYARLPETPPEEKYRCVQRALRASALDDELAGILGAIANLPEVVQSLACDLTDSGKMVLTAPFDESLDRPTMEAVRIKAYLLHEAGFIRDAIGMQRYAASLYRRLETENSPFRRAHAAEVDAFERLARWLLESWRSNEIPGDATADQAMAPIPGALEAIRAAERYAVLGLPHDRLAHPQPELGFVFGEVMPTAFPERLRPLWRFSALMHLLAGKDQFIDYRVYFSLPPEQWTPQAMQREMAALAREAVAELTRLPVDRRPRYFAGLQALANSTTPR